jgi:hypothetical protein
MPSWKKVIVSGSDAFLNALTVTNGITGSLHGTASWAQNAITASYVLNAVSASYAATASSANTFLIRTNLTASGLRYPTTDGLANQSIITDGAGNLLFGNPYSDNTVVYGKNLSGVTIPKGTPLYFTGSGTSGNLVGVFPADAGNPARMPAGGIAGEQLLDEDEGVVLLDGFINGVNTSAFNSGDLVYVAVGGGYTNVAPTGSTNLIQALGYVEKVGVSNGSGVIKGPGIFNSVPNIQQGYTWVGNANGVATPTTTSSFSVASAVSASFATTASYVLNAVSASFATSASITQTAATASFVTASNVFGPFGSNSIISSSYALTASFALNGGGGGGSNPAVTHTQLTASTTWSFNHNLNTQTPLLQVYDLGYEQIIPNEIVSIDAFTSEIRFDYTQAGYAVASSGGGLIVTGSTARLIQTVAATTWSFQHNLGTKYPGFEIFNSNDDVIIPAGIHAVDTNNAEIYFAIPSTGIAIANFSGISGSFENTISASFAATASYSDQFNIGQTQTQYATVTSSINGSNTVFTQATGSYTSAFFKYTVTSGSNARSGEIMSVWNGTTSAFTDNSTIDIGTTTDVTSSVEISGANVQLNMQTNSSGWRIKSIATFM